VVDVADREVMVELVETFDVVERRLTQGQPTVLGERETLGG
jgi:hypothetical protein